MLHVCTIAALLSVVAAHNNGYYQIDNCVTLGDWTGKGTDDQPQLLERHFMETRAVEHDQPEEQDLVFYSRVWTCPPEARDNLHEDCTISRWFPKRKPHAHGGISCNKHHNPGSSNGFKEWHTVEGTNILISFYTAGLSVRVITGIQSLSPAVG